MLLFVRFDLMNVYTIYNKRNIYIYVYALSSQGCSVAEVLKWFYTLPLECLNAPVYSLLPILPPASNRMQTSSSPGHTHC